MKTALVAAAAVLLAAAPASVACAQTSVTSSGGAPTLPSPTESQYDGGGAIGPSTSITFTAKCDNGGQDCPMKLAFSPTVFDLQWQYVSAPTPTSDCAIGTFTAGVFRDVSASTILTVTKNRTCTVILRFQAKALTAPGSWTSYQSPTSYVQPVTLTFQKP